MDGCLNRGSFKMIHELRHKEALEDRSDFHEEFDVAVSFNPSMREFLSKTSQDLSPIAALHLFKRIPDNECVLLNLKGRPEDMIVQTLIVPPACIRPSVTMGASGSNEDDLTVKLGNNEHYCHWHWPPH
jgi:DNA-directed RNA polymerase III subunit RPC1